MAVLVPFVSRDARTSMPETITPAAEPPAVQPVGHRRSRRLLPGDPPGRPQPDQTGELAPMRVGPVGKRLLFDEAEVRSLLAPASWIRVLEHAPSQRPPRRFAVGDDPLSLGRTGDLPVRVIGRRLYISERRLDEWADGEGDVRGNS